MFITRNKLFLRSVLLTAKRTRASKLPAMIRTEDNMKTLHNAMPSDLEGKRFANSDVFFRLSFTADMSIVVNLTKSVEANSFIAEKKNSVSKEKGSTFCNKTK